MITKKVKEKLFSKSLFDIAFERWREKAKKRAMEDPRYSEIEERRHRHGESVSTFLSDEDNLAWRHWERQNAIEEQLTPKPLYLKILIFQRHHKFQFRFKLRRFYQRGKRGWADSDTWSLDHYLARVISESITYLRDSSHSWPGEPMTPDEWNEILTKIADGFENLSKLDYLDELSKEKNDKIMSDFSEAVDLFKEHFLRLWD